MTKEEKKQVEKHRNNGLSYAQISRMLEVSENTIKSYCRRSGLIGDRKSNKPIVEQTHNQCKNCGDKLLQGTRGKPKKFCSEKCRRNWWKENSDKTEKNALYTLVCQECGEAFQSYGNKDRKFCNHACYIKNRFKGGLGHDQCAV